MRNRKTVFRLVLSLRDFNICILHHISLAKHQPDDVELGVGSVDFADYLVTDFFVAAGKKLASGGSGDGALIGKLGDADLPVVKILFESRNKIHNANS